MENLTTVSTINTGSKKRKRRVRKTLARRDEKYRNQNPSGTGLKATCKHSGKTLKCKEFNVEDVLAIRKQFFDQISKVKQDIYLTRFVSPYNPVRIRSTTGSKKRQFSCSYYLRYANKNVQVCANFFQKVFSIKKGRLRTIGKLLHEGKVPIERRGGDRKSLKSAAKKESVRQFIKKLPARESHYNRNKSCRIYLDADLNMKLLWTLYNSTVPLELQVKRTMFTQVFLQDFNIGFASPLSDACGTCILLQNKLKGETDQTIKSQLMVQKRIHKLRANAFYTLLKKDVPNSLTLCFDLQQVLPLPKTPIQDAFYSRQVSLYNFCVVNINSKSPDFYCWNETEAGRGSEAIGSALLSHLNTATYSNDIESLRLFCDGCGGQNKNCHIVHTLAFWIRNKAPKSIKEITIVYPMRGHSFLPADRVFGRLEKDLKKQVVITTPNEYYTLFSKHGTVNKLNEDWFLYDVKSIEKNHYRKIDGIQKLKRIQLKKTTRRGQHDIQMRCHQNFIFEADERFTTLLKRGKTHPKQLKKKTVVRVLSNEKKKDVASLLDKQFGSEWRELEELNWFKELLDIREGIIITDEDEDMDECDCLELECDDCRI